MKKVFGEKRMFFALGFITGAVLVIILTFAIPGKRTYVGGERTGKEILGREIMTELPWESAEKEAEEGIIEVTKAEEKEEEISGEECRVYPSEKPFLEILMEQGKVPTETEETIAKSGESIEEDTGISVESGTGQYTEKESAVFPLIPHDHIPLKWEYKMKE